jgi:peptidoglycan hydrolase-like protein with peptidoglycan-binding domain
MSTTTTTPTSGNSTSNSSSSRGRTVFVTAIAVLVAAGIATGLAIGLSGTTDGTPSAAPTVPAVPASSSTTHRHVVPNTPVPSAAVETLQRELGQLNYYEGPITGTMNTQTEQAITYLQRDANLPQTGTMNAATQAALIHFLATGNNQMGS